MSIKLEDYVNYGSEEPSLKASVRLLLIGADRRSDAFASFKEYINGHRLEPNMFPHAVEYFNLLFNVALYFDEVKSDERDFNHSDLALLLKDAYLLRDIYPDDFEYEVLDDALKLYEGMFPDNVDFAVSLNEAILARKEALRIEYRDAFLNDIEIQKTEQALWNLFANVPDSKLDKPNFVPNIVSAIKAIRTKAQVLIHLSHELKLPIVNNPVSELEPYSVTVGESTVTIDHIHIEMDEDDRAQIIVETKSVANGNSVDIHYDGLMKIALHVELRLADFLNANPDFKDVIKPRVESHMSQIGDPSFRYFGDEGDPTIIALSNEIVVGIKPVPTALGLSD